MLVRGNLQLYHLTKFTSEGLALYCKSLPCSLVYLPTIKVDSSVSNFLMIYNSLLSLIIWYLNVPDFAGGNHFE